MFKKLVGLLTVAVVGLLFSGVVSAQTMTGTAHDFSGAAWSGGAICDACHTPHNSDLTVSAFAPLWDHELAVETGYTVYTGFDLESVPGQPAGISRLCLSCHDGSVALDSFGGAPGTTLIGAVGTPVGYADVTRDLSNDHPIGVTYDGTTVTDDGGLFATSTTYTEPVSGATPTILAGMLNGGSTVECSSCHDVHAQNVAASSLLKVDNANSALCRTCHTK